MNKMIWSPLLSFSELPREQDSKEDLLGRRVCIWRACYFLYSLQSCFRIVICDAHLSVYRDPFRELNRFHYSVLWCGLLLPFVFIVL